MSSRSTIKILLGLVVALLLFHIAVIVKLVPYQFVWGGRLESDAAMYRFEMNAILINLIFGQMLLMKGKFIRVWAKPKIIDRVLWVYFFIFVLNTIVNLLAPSQFEKWLAVFSGLSALLTWKVLRSKDVTRDKAPY